MNSWNFFGHNFADGVDPEMVINLPTEESEDAVDDETIANDGTLYYKDMPSIIGVEDAGTFIKQHRDMIVEELGLVVANTQLKVTSVGFENVGDDRSCIIYASILDPISKTFQERFGEEFALRRKAPLTKGTVLAFILLTAYMSNIGLSRTEFFDDMGRSFLFQRFKHGIGIPREDYDVLFELLDRDEDMRDGAHYHLPFEGSSDVDAICRATEQCFRDLLKGSTELLLNLDDLMIPASSKAMTDRGFSIIFNPRKAAGNGFEFDITTSTFLRLVVNISYLDTKAKREGRTRADIIFEGISDVAKSLGVANQFVLVVCDRGFEQLQRELIKRGLQLIATSRKGGYPNKQVPFSFDLNPAAADKLASFMSNLKYLKQGRFPFSIVRTTEFGERQVYHLAFFCRANGPPTLMKTTVPKMADVWIAYPRKGCDTRRLYRDAVVESQQSAAASFVQSAGAAMSALADIASNIVQAASSAAGVMSNTVATMTPNVSVASTSGLLPSPPNSVDPTNPTTDEAGSRSLTSRFFQNAPSTARPIVVSDASLENASKEKLNAHLTSNIIIFCVNQRRSMWFLFRYAITSTTLDEVVIWLRSIKEDAMLRGEDDPNLEALTALVCKESVNGENIPFDLLACDIENAPWLEVAQSGIPNDEVEDHRLYIMGMSKQEVRICEAYHPVVGEGLQTASDDQLHAAAKLLKVSDLPQKSRKNKENWATPTQRDRMREGISEGLSKLRGKLNLDLADRMISRWTGDYPGNDATRLGQWMEDKTVENLRQELIGNVIHTMDGDQMEFDFVSDVCTTGCVGPSLGSACLASTDGFFVARIKGQDELHMYVLEVKTKSGEDALSSASAISRNKSFYIDDTTTAEEQEVIVSHLLSRSYALQCLHHCASSRIPRLVQVIMDGKAGKLLRFTVVEYSEILLERHRLFVDFVAYTFLPFLFRPTKVEWGGVSPERLNFVRQLKGFIQHAEIDYEERYIVPLLVFIYNTYKSGSDMIHKELQRLEFHATGTARKLSISVLMITHTCALRVIKLVEMKQRIATAESPEHILDIVNSAGSMKILSVDIAQKFQTPKYGYGQNASTSVPHGPRDSHVNWDPTSDAYIDDIISLRNEAITDRELRSKLYPERRLADTTFEERRGLSEEASYFFHHPKLMHFRVNRHVKLPHKQVMSRSRPGVKVRCVMCCIHCENAEKNQQSADEHYRDGYKTIFKCDTCQVYLCKEERAIWEN